MTDSMGQREEEDVMGARDGAATQGAVLHMIYGGRSFYIQYNCS